jgi:hypothetical protein
MKTFANPNPPSDEEVSVIETTPRILRRDEFSRPGVAPGSASVSGSDAAVIAFLRQFRVLVGAARLYQRNHPRLMEILASAEHQLRAVLSSQSPLVLAVERNGIILPRYDANSGELLNDPKGDLLSLAEGLLRSGICSLLISSQINVGELDLFAREISLVPRSATPGDTSSRKAWDKWLRDHNVAGIRVNVPTERRDSLLLASFVSAVFAYDDAPLHSSASHGKSVQPAATFDHVSETLRILGKLTPPRDPETQTSAEDLARRTHSVLSGKDRLAVSLVAHAVSNVKPREGETMEPYLERLGDALTLGFVKQEFESGRAAPPEVLPLLIRLDQARSEILNAGTIRFGSAQHNETRVASLCEKFWIAQSAEEKMKTLYSNDAWCVPAPVVAQLLEPLSLAADKEKADDAGREGRSLLQAYAFCLNSEEGKPRRAVAAGLAELAPQIERLWPHPSIPEFGKRIVRSLMQETSPGIAGLLTAAVENLARVSLVKHEYGEFERILETLESAPRNDDHAHISTLVGRIRNDDQWLHMVDNALTADPLGPVVPRLLRRSPDRLIDRLGLLLTAREGIDALPAMMRLVHGCGEPVLGALESRLSDPRRQRIATAIYLLASADPKRLADALPRVLPSWEWNLQDLAVSELARWTNPAVVSATAKAFLASVTEAHAMVVPVMIDHLGFANEAAAVPLLLKIATGECLGLRDIYLRIKAVEALGKMRVAEAAPLLLRIVRERNGLSRSEPAALRAAAEEALALLESGPLSTGARSPAKAHSKPDAAHARSRKYPRAQLETPPHATIAGNSSVIRVLTISLGGAFLETDRRSTSGESLQVEFRAGIRRIQLTAVVRNITPKGVGIEFVHMKPESRERLRRFVLPLLK